MGSMRVPMGMRDILDGADGGNWPGRSRWHGCQKRGDNTEATYWFWLPTAFQSILSNNRAQT